MASELDDPRLASADARRLVESADGGDQWVAPDETAIPVKDSVDRRHDLLQLSGWATHVEGNEPVRHVVLFKHGEFLYAARPAFERADVLQFFNNEGLRDTGFRITLPAELLGDADSVRAFAVSRNGQASELQYFDEVEWRNES